MFKKKIKFKGIILFGTIENAENLSDILSEVGYIVDYSPNVSGVEIYKF
jgi:hypothetical protein